MSWSRAENNNCSEAAHRGWKNRMAVLFSRGGWIPLLIGLAGLFASEQSSAQSYATSCQPACHIGQSATDPNLGRVNAANSSAIILRASTQNSMSITAGVAATVAAEIGGLVAQTQSDNIDYGATKTFTLNNLYFGGAVIDQHVQISGPTVTPTIVGSQGQFSYTHSGGAGGNCTTQSVVTRGRGTPNFTGQGEAGADTSNRTVNISINAPSPPTTSAGSAPLTYSTSAQGINLNSLGLIASGPTDTPVGSSTTVSLNSLSPNVGTIAATGPATLTYASSATVHAPTLTVNYTVTGPCNTTATTRQLTINIGLPAAPTVAAAGPFSVAAATPTANVTTLTSTGVVLSNPSGTYNFAIASQPPAGQGTVSLSGANNSVVTYTPDSPFTFSGPTSFTYTRIGPGGTSTAATVTLNVTAAPLVTGTSVTTAFNTPIPVNVSGLVTGTFTSVTGQNPVNGTVGTVGNVITFTPNPSTFFGTGTFEFTATGPGGTSTPATVTVTVNPPVPTAGAGTATVAYNTATPINLSAFITPAATVTSVAVSGVPTNGGAVVSGTTTITFTPTSGYVGAASFNYTATNVAGTSTAGTVTITVSPPGPPVASNRTVGIPAGTPTPIDLSTSVAGVSSSIALGSLPANGLAAVSGYVVTYTPATGFTGTDSFTYTATGIGGTSAPATVTLTVISAPTVSTLNVVVPFNTPTAINLGSIISGQATTIGVITPPLHGSFAPVSGGGLVYVPTTGYHGPDSFVIVVSGPGGASQPATINITVNPDVPAPGSLTVNTAFNTVAVIDLRKAVNGVATQFTLVQATQNGTLVINGTNATYTPKPGYSGPDSFSVIPTGPGGVGAETTVTINVGSQIPVARNASIVVKVNQSFTIDVAALINGSNVTGVNVAGKPAYGTADVAGTKLTYTPRTNYFGPDSFSYVAFGNAGTSGQATITVLVEGERPNAASDPTVKGIANAQGRAARQFATGQMNNFGRRLEGLRSGLATGTDEPDQPAAQPTTTSSLRPKAPAQLASANIRNRATSVADAADPFAPLQAGGDVGYQQPGLGVKGPPVDTVTPPTLVSTLVGMVTGRSFDLTALNAAAGVAAGADSTAGRTSVWMGGTINMGRRDATADAASAKFTTEGISLGVDRRFNDRLVLGLGVGFGRDETDIGSDGSRLKASGSSVVAYGSHQLGRNTYVDSMLGFGRLNLDTRRYVSSMDEFAFSKRKGDQVFGSLAAGWEWRRDALLISPYGRVDFTRDRFKLATESGAGLAALTYLEQTQRSTQLAVGLRVEIQHPTDFGWVKPRARIEYRHELEGDRNASVAYADQYSAGGPRYAISSAGSTRNSLAVGIGADFLYRGGLKLGIDYQALRVKGPESSQSVRLLITQDLDAKAFPADAVAWKTGRDAVRVETGYSWDDNITRARDANSKLSDSIFNLGLGYGRFFPLGSNSRFAANGFINGEKFRNHGGLGSASFGMQGELQYRTSAAFDAVTFGLFARASHDEFESSLRDGQRYSVGVNARRSITDRIDVFGELAGNVRYAKSAVFDRRDVSIRGNVDYTLTKKSTLYLTAEYRRGDVVSTGFPSLENLNIADVLVQDDAFDGQFFSYRTEAKTVLGTMGFNLSLGPRDSIDFSWRRAQSKPVQGPGFQVNGAFRYVANQYVVVYLTRF